MKIYRVTRTRKNPSYYKSAVSVKICNLKSLMAQIRAIQQIRDHFYRYRDRYSLTEPNEDIIKIEEAQVGEFTDVTESFIRKWDAEDGIPL